MARHFAILLLLGLCVSFAHAHGKTCDRREWKRVFGASGGRLTNASARSAMRHIVHAVAEERALQRRTGTLGCELVKYSAIIGCNDNSPVKHTAARANLWFVKYQAAYSCQHGRKYLTIWAYTSNPSNPHSVKVSQAVPTGHF